MDILSRRADDVSIDAGRKVQQQMGAGGYPEDVTDKNDRRDTPIYRTPKSSDTEPLDRDAANEHQMKEYSAARCREGESRDAGDHGGRKNGKLLKLPCGALTTTRLQLQGVQGRTPIIGIAKQSASATHPRGERLPGGWCSKRSGAACCWNDAPPERARM